jgi:uncharacterized protein
MARLAMVTGASSGIGAAYAEQLAGEGWDLVVVARRHDRLDDLAGRLMREHGIDVRARPADLSDVEQLGALSHEVIGMPIEMLVNNAALAHYKPFAELAPDEAQALVELNVLAPVLLTRSVIPGMIDRRAGAVINVASLLAFSGTWDGPHLPMRGVYASSKAFLVTFTQLLANELHETGVRVQVVCPGIVRSEFHSRQGMDLSAVPRMEPDAVVRASLLDLEQGTVVSIPGAPDDSALEAVVAAQHQLLGITRTVELPDRYAAS